MSQMCSVTFLILAAFLNLERGVRIYALTNKTPFYGRACFDYHDLQKKIPVVSYRHKCDPAGIFFQNVPRKVFLSMKSSTTYSEMELVMLLELVGMPNVISEWADFIAERAKFMTKRAELSSEKTQINCV